MPLKIFLIFWLKRKNQKAPKQANKIHKSQKCLECLQKAMQLIFYPVSMLAGLSGIPPASSYALLKVCKDFESVYTQEALVHHRV